MKLLYKFLLIILFPLWGLAGYAQLYPVQLTPVFSTPYSVRLSDYANSMDTKLQLFVNPTDITMNARQVRLKLIIQGNGIAIQSSSYLQGQNPIYVNGGEPQTLTNVDIGALFRLENLDGISAVQYANPLPEGMYNFCFELYDMMTNQRLSQKSCAMMYLQLNDPPLLNIPAKNEQIPATDFPNILFTWTPRQINATNVSYTFELKEILDPNLDPQFAFQMSPLLYQETDMRSTALLYNLGMPTLIPGKKYAWRVKATSTSGLSENSIFKNNGYSEIFYFKYATNCAAPTFLLSETQSSKTAKISWQFTAEHLKYHVQYRTKGITGAEWFSTHTQNNQTLLTGLEPGTTYEFRVGATCDPLQYGVEESYIYSGIQEFTMPAKNSEEQGYNCGITPSVNITNQTPLTNLIVSETFTAGDFPVKVLEVTGQNPYSGRGYIVVPYLADTKIAVRFTNISINTDYKLIQGVVETTYNPTWQNVEDLEDFTGEGQGGQIEQNVPFVITTVMVNTNGNIVVNGPNGEQITIPGGKDTVITDQNGTVYYVDSNGNISDPVAAAPGGKPTPNNTDGVDSNGQATAFTAQGVSITFSGADSQYGFDSLPAGAPASLAQRYKKVGTAALPYKAVVNGQTDTLLATITITDSDIKPEDVVFKTQNGALIPVQHNGRECILTLRGAHTYAEEQVLATIKQGDKWKVIAAFMLVHISPKEMNLAFVSLNNTPIPVNAELEIKNIYAKAGIKFNIASKVENITYSDADNKIETGNSDLLSVYTSDEQSINALIKQLPGYKTDTYYLIYSNLPASQTALQGFMALKGQFGYVFPEAAFKTGAHELGHGVFGLEHPFSTDADKGKTNFLMDYGNPNANILWHNDWQQINDSNFRLYLFQGDSEGELAGGFALAPDWSFVSAGTENRTVINRNLADDGFLGGFKVGTIKYSWNKDERKYIGDHNEIFHQTTMPIGSSIIWLLYDNDKACGNYLRTTYEQVQSLVAAHNTQGLLRYIADNKNTTDRTQLVYSAPLGCENGTGNGAFYDAHKNNSNLDLALLKEVSELLKGYGNDFYQKYISKTNGTVLTNEKLQNFKKVLNEEIEFERSLFGNYGSANYEKILAFIEKCQSDYAQQTEGYIPRCLWDHDQNVPYVADMALSAGFTDGLIEIGVSTYQIGKFSSCWDITNTLQFTTTDCIAVREKTIIILKLIYKTFSSWEDFTAATSGVYDAFAEYVDTTAQLDNQGRYNQGKIIFDVVSLFIGVGEVNAILKGEKTLTTVIKEGITSFKNLPQSVARLVLNPSKKITAKAQKGVAEILLFYQLNTGEVKLGTALNGTFTPENWIEIGNKLEVIENCSYLGKDAKVVNGSLEIIEKDGVVGVRVSSNLPSTIRQLTTKPSYKPLRTIYSKQNKTTTFIGKWDEIIEGQQNGLQKIFYELSETDLNIYMQSGKFDNTGGFNMLSIEDWETKVGQEALKKGISKDTKAFDDFIWDTYNKPWLQNSMQRGDEIIIWSNPLIKENIEKYFKFEGIIDKSFYGREIDFIKNNAANYGYDFNEGINLGTFIKK